MNINYMIALVQAYIHHKTGQTVSIIIRNNSNDSMFLIRAFNTASEYFEGGEVTIIK